MVSLGRCMVSPGIAGCKIGIEEYGGVVQPFMHAVSLSCFWPLEVMTWSRGIVIQANRAAHDQ